MRGCMIIIFGPTGVGKTDFGETLARKIPAEIVNADLGQFYTPLSIGTAKPNWQTSPIPQHLFDIINEPRVMSVTEYRDRALQTFNDIWARGKIPIIIGGSGFYIKSLFFPPQAGSVNAEINYPVEGDGWKQLYTIDAERALKIHPNDSYRIKRALSIYYATGRKPSEYQPSYQPVGSFCFVYLTRQRQDLYTRIDQRVKIMFDAGWIEEVERLQGTAWESFLKKKKLIGYDDILEYLEGNKKERQLNALIDLIAQKTRNYAKRQITLGNQLFGQLENVLFQTSDKTSSCVQFDLTCPPIELYINQLLRRVDAMHCFDKDRSEYV